MYCDVYEVDGFNFLMLLSPTFLTSGRQNKINIGTHYKALMGITEFTPFATLSAVCSSDFRTLAFSSSCMLDPQLKDRPVAGFINLCSAVSSQLCILCVYDYGGKCMARQIRCMAFFYEKVESKLLQ